MRVPGATADAAEIGPYRCLRRIGAGGMGEVYLAYDQRLERQVAVKHLKPDEDRSVPRERLRREARAVARLSHPAIVQVFELLEAPDGDWIVMEYVDGPSLAEKLRRGPLSLPEVLSYGGQIAAGLAEAHAKGIVHRDLKAENVMITSSGQAKILDFGLARDLEAPSHAPALSRSGAVLGTVRTMAPEQARGLKAGPRADLFSLGVLLYEMITGRSPFQGATVAESLHRLLGEPPEPLSAETPAELRRLVDQLLEKAPEQRPASSDAVARRLLRMPSDIDPDPVASPTAADEATELSAALAAEALPEAHRSRWRPAVAALALLAIVGLGLGLKVVGPSGVPVSPAETLPVAEARELLKRGRQALERYDLPGRTDHAIEMFQRVIESLPDSAPAHAALARAYWRKHNHDSGDQMWLDQALAVARRAVELDDELEEARVSLGLALLRAGRTDEARVELLKAPGNPDAHRGLADIHDSEGRYQEAETELRRALELNPDSRELFDHLGSLFYRQGRLEEAATLFRRSIELAPQGIEGYRNLAAVLFAGGQPEEASAIIAQALEIQPSASLFVSQGTILFYQGLYPHAAAAFEKALEYDAGVNYYLTWANLGDAYRLIPHRRSEAAEMFRQAIRLLGPRLENQPDDARLRSRMALYYAKAGNRDAALRHIELVSGADGRSLFRLAVASEVLGRRQQALEILGRALGEGCPQADVEREPELLALRADRRYHRLMAQLGR